MKRFVLGSRSRTRLTGVHPDLIRVVERAIELTEVDFTVLEGLRDRKRQAKLVDAGASQTMNSRHLTGHAVDLGAWVGGTVRWDWPLYYKIAAAMKAAAQELGIAMVWGGVWDRPLNQIDDTEDASADYVRRRREQGSRAFIDGPHFELDKRHYPA